MIDGALDGIRVLDFSSFFATAYGAKLLWRPGELT